MRFIDSFLNSVTMYRLVLYVLRILAGVGIVFGFLGLLPYSGVSLVITLVIIMISCLVSNLLFAKLFKAIVNYESYAITLLILFLILAPVKDGLDVAVTIAAGIIAMGSKYLLAYDKKHIFNPAAIAVFLLGLFGFGNAIWWVGSLVMLPFTLVLGLLIVRKIRRFHLLWAFLIPAIITVCLFNLRNGLSVQDSLQQLITSWPIVFFGTIMLTEPYTTPPRKKNYMVYGGLVGILFGTQFSFGPLFASPEFALVAGNIFSFIISPKQKLFLRLVERRQLAPTIFEFIFSHPQPFRFLPGQYLEWTVPPVHVDRRGNRRYFTISSSPTEKEIKLGVKVIPETSSQFKKQLFSLKPGDSIVASQLAGDFVLPQDSSRKLVFIAGGIGVTPFRSMVQYLIDMKQKRDIIFFYANATSSEIAYRGIFDTAVRVLGMQIIYLISKDKEIPKDLPAEAGRLNDTILKKYVHDIADRTFYLSGPNAMVEGYKELLLANGVSRGAIVTDYFPGF